MSASPSSVPKNINPNANFGTYSTNGASLQMGENLQFNPNGGGGYAPSG